MTLAQFQAALRRHGANLERWSDAEQAAALVVLASSSEARAAWDHVKATARAGVPAAIGKARADRAAAVVMARIAALSRPAAPPPSWAERLRDFLRLPPGLVPRFILPTLAAAAMGAFAGAQIVDTEQAPGIADLFGSSTFIQMSK
ncbi:MAG TPA: hypothetical protein VK558_00345 [Patescibacteria group bacterium]|nr:hypothetical protein [Patescibacteria group bacterium]